MSEGGRIDNLQAQDAKYEESLSVGSFSTPDSDGDGICDELDNDSSILSDLISLIPGGGVGALAFLAIATSLVATFLARRTTENRRKSVFEETDI